MAIKIKIPKNVSLSAIMAEHEDRLELGIETYISAVLAYLERDENASLREACDFAREVSIGVMALRVPGSN